MTETAPPDLPERPEDAMAALGIEAEAALPGLDALAAVKAELKKDLEERQGPFRRASAVGKYWPFALAAVFGAFLVVLLKPQPGAGWEKLLASVLAGGAGLFCLIAAAFAPTRPGLGERLALGGLLLALVAGGFEVFIAARMPGDALDLGAKCGGVLVVAALLPMAALFFGVKRSGLPVRRAHAAAIAASAMAMAGATVWMHCPAENLWHLTLGHVGIPLVVAVGLSVGLFYLFARRPRPQAA